MSCAKKMNNKKIKMLKEEIARLRSQWPAHSVSPTMILRLDDLEEELEKALKKNETKRDVFRIIRNEKESLDLKEKRIKDKYKY